MTAGQQSYDGQCLSLVRGGNLSGDLIVQRSLEAQVLVDERGLFEALVPFVTELR